jgi:hypothetical protein
LNSQCIRMTSDAPFAAELYKSANWVYCFQSVTPCSLAVCYRTFGSSRFFQNGSNIYLQNLGNDLSDYTAPRKAVRFIAHCCENTESRISVCVYTIIISKFSNMGNYSKSDTGIFIRNKTLCH